MREKFPFKETMLLTLWLNVSNRSGEGGKGGRGGGGCNNLFINSDFKTTQHRYKENKFLTFYQSTF